MDAIVLVPLSFLPCIKGKGLSRKSECVCVFAKAHAVFVHVCGLVPLPCIDKHVAAKDLFVVGKAPLLKKGKKACKGSFLFRVTALVEKDCVEPCPLHK